MSKEAQPTPTGSLGQRAAGPNGTRPPVHDILQRVAGHLRAVGASNGPAVAWCLLLTGLVCIPWLRGGFLFGTDFPGPRYFRLPTALDPSAPIETLLALLSTVLGGEWTGKLLIFTTLFLAALSAFVCLPMGGFLPRASASLIYLLNPFVWDRLHYGEVFLLTGYAVMPWAVRTAQRLIEKPRVSRGVGTAIWIVAISSLAVHLLLIFGLITLIYGLAMLISRRRDGEYIRQLFLSLAATGLGAIALTAYWLAPFLTGTSQGAQIISRVGSGDLQAFQTAADPHLGLYLNVLGLYGFWGESTGLVPSMKVFTPAWPLVLILMLFLGVLVLFRAALPTHSTGLSVIRGWVLTLAAAAVASFFLSLGVADPHIAPLVRFIDRVLPIYRGMRDAGKWTALLALTYAQLIPLGILLFQERVESFRRDLRSLGRWAVPVIALGLPLAYGNGLLFGAHGEIQPSAYPASWYRADQVISSGTSQGRAVFLPWHLYLTMSFVRNANPLVRSPAPTFFSIPAVVSNDPELLNVAPPLDTHEQRVLANLVAQGKAGHWAQDLAGLHIRYILLAREVDWQSYGYLGSQSGFTRLADLGEIVVYENILVSNRS